LGVPKPEDCTDQFIYFRASHTGSQPAAAKNPDVPHPGFAPSVTSYNAPGASTDALEYEITTETANKTNHQ